jgi:uncharacterized protein with HEPN domain
MQRDPAAYLWDVQFACRNVLDFVREASAERLASDIFLRSAVERQLQNMGEALSQLARIDRALAEQVPEHRQIVAFRNVLVHGYATLDQRVVWRVICNDVPALLTAIEALLARMDPPPSE